MNPSEAREHLQMADRIVAASTRELSMCGAGPFFITWGLFSASVDVMFQLARDGIVPVRALWIEPALLLVAIVLSVLYGRRLGREKGERTFLHREYLNVLWITLAISFVATAGGFRLFPDFGLGGIWSVAASIVLFYIGLHANRRALAGGVVVMASLIIANFSPAIVGYVLAAGFLVGYTGFGLSELGRA